MKATVVLVQAISLFSAVVGVTVTMYSDPACTTKSSITGIPNPAVVNLNTCNKGAGNYYEKYTSCTPNTADGVVNQWYADASCSTTMTGGGKSSSTGSCVNIGAAVPGIGSVQFVCAPASTATLALAAAAAVVLAACV
jgi:hypothetical protein